MFVEGSLHILFHFFEGWTHICCTAALFNNVHFLFAPWIYEDDMTVSNSLTEVVLCHDILPYYPPNRSVRIEYKSVQQRVCLP